MSGCRVFPHLSQVSPLWRCNFHSLNLPRGLPRSLPHPSQVSVLLHFLYSINGTFHSLEALWPSTSLLCCNFHSLEACLILAKSLLCCNFHSLEACLAACLLLAKSLFCSTFHSINGNFYSLEACLPRGLPHPSQASVLLHFPSHPWQSSRPASS